ncbi:Protein NRT1/ PTR family 5.10 [Vitis vinifera]|uniref:Protein NRT1/ PTR family 5.10 n=2 Tax=Vitis vinifera TaxID=29760 RepID=A0A438FF24_VITVI|eukprot:XP_002266023.1 PREDICTED: protein NRT1/ PTR FAMILY 5.10 [Vitis vinifera]
MAHSGILPHAHTPLLDDTLDSAVDYKGRPARRCSSGRWRSACFIIGVEVAERFAYYGIESNLINYLTGRLGQSMATAAQNVNTWSGTASMLPLLGAFVADSYVGRYPTIVIASLLYILGLGLLTVSAVLPSFNPSHCQTDKEISSCSPPMLQVILFFFALYLVAVGQGGHKPCVQAFGADQFDGKNPEESKAKSSFFNWWYFCMSGGILINSSILNYIQDNLNWGLGFGIPCTTMVAALFVFLLGTKTYRYSVKGDEKNPFLKIGWVFVAAIKNWHTTDSSLTDEEVAHGTWPHQCSHKFKFLNKALLAPDGSKEDGKVCSVSDVEEAKSVLRLFPIWASCLAFAIVFAQPPTFFTKQGVTMDRSIGSGFKVPAASLQCFISLSILLFVPIYDRILVPTARVLTRKPSGITMLQRIGTGMLLSVIAMVFAALVEVQRLKTAEQYGLVDIPYATVPMAVWWLIPQYVIFGVAQVFTMVGLQEFFYDEVPNELRSVGLSLYLSIFGVGSFLSSFLISVINKTTGGDGQTSWFNDNLNQAHLDYFYWLLAGLSTVGLSTYLYSARSYIYNSTSTT